MGNPYSVDLRSRVLKDYDDGKFGQRIWCVAIAWREVGFTN